MSVNQKALGAQKGAETSKTRNRRLSDRTFSAFRQPAFMGNAGTRGALKLGGKNRIEKNRNRKTILKCRELKRRLVDILVETKNH